MFIIIKVLKYCNKLPSFYWDKRNKIRRIKYYHFYDNFTKKDEKDKKITIKLVKNNLNKWLNEDIKGLIIDIRSHRGGNMWVFVVSLSQILGKTTLLAFTNKRLSKKNGWINNESKKINLLQVIWTLKYQ